jgi:hypothetical protein
MDTNICLEANQITDFVKNLTKLALPKMLNELLVKKHYLLRKISMISKE